MLTGFSPYITYKYKIPGHDPVLETLAAPYIYKLEHNEYYISPALGITSIGFRNPKGELKRPEFKKIYPILSLLNNPFTLIGDTQITVTLGANKKPGPGFHPLSLLTNIYPEPKTSYSVEFTAVAATMTKATRRGLDLIISMINTELILYTLTTGKNQKTLEALLQALLYKTANIGTELRSKTSHTTRYLALYELSQTSRDILDKIIKEPAKVTRILTDEVLSSKKFMEQILGKYYINTSPPTGAPDSIGKKLLPHLEQTAKNVANTHKNIIYFVTGQTSFADLYHISKIPNIQNIHLLITPETIPIITYLTHRLNGKITQNNTLTLKLNNNIIEAKLYLASYTDYHLTKTIISSIPDHILYNKKIYKL